MQSNTRSRGDELEELRDLLDSVDRSIARAVTLAGRIAASGACERAEGLTLDVWLAVAARLTGGDAKMLLTAADVLAHMPVTAGLFATGKLSWGQVRAIVSTARGFGARRRSELDGRVAATAETLTGVEGYDPDELLWAVQAAAEDLRDRAVVERREQRLREASFVAVQQAFDGGVAGYFELDPVLGATVVGALDAAAGPPAPADDAEVGDGVGETPATDEARWTGTSRGRQYAQALGRVCGDWLGGGGGRAARPLLVAHVDLRQLDTTTPGVVETRVRGGLPRLTAAAAEALAGDADVQAVVFDGARPLAVTGKIDAATIPSATRVAVRARDRGCRWPGCRAPIGHCDLHHLQHRSDGGDHHPENPSKYQCAPRRHSRPSPSQESMVALAYGGSTGMLTEGNEEIRCYMAASPLASAPAAADWSPRFGSQVVDACAVLGCGHPGGV